MGEPESIKPEEVERRVMCDCMTWAGIYPDSWGQHHHKECPKYKTGKYPYLFYYEEAVCKWLIASDKVEDLIDVVDMSDDDIISLDFKCLCLTDEEFDALPED